MTCIWYEEDRNKEEKEKEKLELVVGVKKKLMD